MKAYRSHLLRRGFSVTNAQVAYAQARALNELLLAELRAALDKHERKRRWEEHAVPERVERVLTALLEELR